MGVWWGGCEKGKVRCFGGRLQFLKLEQSLTDYWVMNTYKWKVIMNKMENCGDRDCILGLSLSWPIVCQPSLLLKSMVSTLYALYLYFQHLISLLYTDSHICQKCAPSINIPHWWCEKSESERQLLLSDGTITGLCRLLYTIPNKCKWCRRWDGEWWQVGITVSGRRERWFQAQ